MPQGYAQVTDDVRLWYETFGDSSNPTVVLSHGGLVDALMWDDGFCTQLADRGLHVVRYDQRDAGMSTHLDDYPAEDWWELVDNPPYNWETCADDAVALIDHLGVEKAHFMGFSAGAVISHYVALNHPDRCASAILWASFITTFPSDDVELAKHSVKMATMDWLIDVPEDRDGRAQWLHDFLRGFHGTRYDWEEDRWMKWAYSAIDRGWDPIAWRRAYAGNATAKQRLPLVPTTEPPILVIHGWSDIWAKFEDGAMIAGLSPRGQMLMLAGVGHELPSPIYPAVTKAVANHVHGRRIYEK